MDSYHIPDGVWPVMLTPFTRRNEIDYAALEKLVAWYKDAGVAGLFAVCQSSELFYMTLEERTALAKAVVSMADGLPVVVSGHIASDLYDQAYELKVMADTGAQAIVLIANRMARSTESDAVWKRNTEWLLRQLPDDMPLGLYECPYPYKRLMNEDTIRWCVDTGRFCFLKDTCGFMPSIAAKQHAMQGTSMKLYNANSTTLLDSLRIGVKGYCGVMANFHPDLYVWLCAHSDDRRAEQLLPFLSLASLIEYNAYPICAKYGLQQAGIPIELTSRRIHEDALQDEWKRQVDHIRQLENVYRALIAD